MKKICCIGEALIDMICTDAGVTLSKGVNFLKKAGGAPTNVAAAINALGGNSSIIAKVGADPFGDFLIDELKQFDIDTQYVFRSSLFTTFAFVSLMENGERDFYFNRGADAALDLEDLQKIPLHQFDIFHFGSATAFLPGTLQITYQNVFDFCLNNKKIISFDPNYRHLLFQHQKAFFISKCWEYLPQVHFFKMSDEEAMLITHTSNLKDAVHQLQAKLNGAFAITLGKDGTLFSQNNEECIIPSIPIIPIDTTGAGDAFVGAVLKQLSDIAETPNQISFENWKKIISKANIAGAKTCEYMGAMEAFKFLTHQILA